MVKTMQSTSITDKVVESLLETNSHLVELIKLVEDKKTRLRKEIDEAEAPIKAGEDVDDIQYGTVSILRSVMENTMKLELDIYKCIGTNYSLRCDIERWGFK